MRVLFICKHNRFRSKVAEVFFKFYVKKKKLIHRAGSRGIKKDIPSALTVVNIMRERGMEIRNKTSKKIEKKDVGWADKIVIVANNVLKKDLEKIVGRVDKKIIVWKIRDTDQNNIKEIKKIINNIEKRVREFVKLI